MLYQLKRAGISQLDLVTVYIIIIIIIIIFNLLV